MQLFFGWLHVVGLPALKYVFFPARFVKQTASHLPQYELRHGIVYTAITALMMVLLCQFFGMPAWLGTTLVLLTLVYMRKPIEPFFFVMFILVIILWIIATAVAGGAVSTGTFPDAKAYLSVIALGFYKACYEYAYTEAVDDLATKHKKQRAEAIQRYKDWRKNKT